MRRISIILFAAMVSGVIFCSGVEATRIFDSKLSPENVAIIDNGIKYMPNFIYDHTKGSYHYIEAWDVHTGKKLWEQKIYEILFDMTMEQDVQERFITSLRIADGKLIITNENNDEYMLDLSTKEVMKTH